MNPLPQRRSIRLPEYDYSQLGYYYLTICIQNRELYFENNDIKQMIDNQWQELRNKFPNIDLDEYVIMPNHLHGIIVITNDKFHGNTVGADLCVCPNKYGDHIGSAGDHKGRPYGNKSMINPVGVGLVPIGDIIGAFKSITTNHYIQGIKTENWPSFNKQLWQRNYYEHIIRNEQSLNKIREYIKNNPLNWETDRNNPKNWK